MLHWVLSITWPTNCEGCWDAEVLTHRMRLLTLHTVRKYNTGLQNLALKIYWGRVLCNPTSALGRYENISKPFHRILVYKCVCFKIFHNFSGGSDGKESACNTGDPDSIPRLEDPLEEGMTTHSSILAWEILWTGEPGGLHGGRKRVGHDLKTKQQLWS